MSRRNTKYIKAALQALYYSRGHKLLAPFAKGVGAIFMLHHVTPQPVREFEPNRILGIAPQFLEEVIYWVRENGFDVISLDEAHYRLIEGEFDRSFVCFTFDDGYRDNRDFAYPIFKRHNLPMAIYVPSDFADGAGNLWWLALEHIVREVDQLRMRFEGEMHTFVCGDAKEKEATYHALYWWLRAMGERDARGVVAGLSRSIGFDPSELSRELVMTWDELRQLTDDPLVTIGGHTKSHFALSKLSLGEARIEIESNLTRIETELGRRPTHFSYPYGSEESAGAREFTLTRELGLKTAVTTRKGVLYSEHAEHLMALPRVSLNGDFQDLKYLSVLMSGVPFRAWNGFRRLNAA